MYCKKDQMYLRTGNHLPLLRLICSEGLMELQLFLHLSNILESGWHMSIWLRVILSSDSGRHGLRCLETLLFHYHMLLSSWIWKCRFPGMEISGNTGFYSIAKDSPVNFRVDGAIFSGSWNEPGSPDFVNPGNLGFPQFEIRLNMLSKNSNLYIVGHYDKKIWLPSIKMRNRN